MVSEEANIDYDVVSEIAGHQSNKMVKVSEAAKDIFTKVREKSMQVAVKGEFISFTTVAELESKLTEAAGSGFSIRVFDEVIGG
jgi:hypothetical protein